MTTLPANKGPMPDCIVLEKPPFVPRMVMTEELQTVTREVLHQWRNRKAFDGLKKYGIRPLDRLLFYGPPGNGKTMACFWIARELGIPVFRVLCNAMKGGHMGQTSKAVDSVMKFFDSRSEPAVCLWDEVESIFMDRSDVKGECDRETAAALTIFMQSLDRWRCPTLLVMATNLVEQLDPALLSRVELRIEFTGPNQDQCKKVVEYWSELLHDHGGADWGPIISERVSERPAASFRELQQEIAFAAREWTARKC